MIKLLARKLGYVVLKMPECVRESDAHRAAHRHTFMQPIGAINLYELCCSTRNVRGDVAEVGVAGGESARIMLDVLGYRGLHLFDTFEGLPEVLDVDKAGGFRKGQYHASLGEVIEYLGEEPLYHIGLFPETTWEIPPCVKFSFVHLDADLKITTEEALGYFWPRMSKKGIILGHDYQDGPRVLAKPGVREAWDDFSYTHNAPLVLLPNSSQVMVVKC